MAESQSKIDAAAAKAFAEAAEKKLAAAAKPAVADDKAKTGLALKSAAATKPAKKSKPVVKAAQPAVTKAAAAKPIAAKPVVAKPAASEAAKPLPVPVSPVRTIKPTTTIAQLKDKIMETTTTATNDFAAKMQDSVAQMQTRAKAAYEKGAELTADVTAFHKGNFDALVESGKVLAAGVQELSRSAVEDAKSAADTMTSDIKAMAAVKSPTELFQLQGEIARRNLDAIVAKTSKNAEVMMKLANDIFAPLSNRASVAVERVTKAA
jgi:phasin family protein